MLVFHRYFCLLPKGHGKIAVESPGRLTTIGMEFTTHPRPKPQQKKSPSGLSTEGVSSPSQYIRSTRSRRTKTVCITGFVW